MAAKIIDGRALASAQLDKLKTEVADFISKNGVVPSVTILRVGADEGSVTYARQIRRTFERAGATASELELPADVKADQVLVEVRRLNANSSVHGIMLQAPLPAGLPWRVIADAIEPPKDVDGVTATNLGLLAAGDSRAMAPATPAGGMALLRLIGVEAAGSLATVVGRSTVVGLPLALMLIRAHSTVTVCHTRTPDLAAAGRSADILCVAAGRANLVRANMVKPGATVLDFGVNFVDGKLTGDVAFDEVVEVAGQITPVPGGTGPMTNVCLLENTLKAARLALGG